MKKEYIQKLINLGFLESKDICTIYGQEVIDNFLDILITKLKQNDFKHYNIDFINSNNIQGKYYRINSHYLEVSISKDINNNEALDLQYLFSKILKDTLGISLIEGYRNKYNQIYYYGYIYLKNFELMYEIKQNNSKAYLRFNILNVLYSIIKDNSYLSYLIAPSLAIIPLHQNKSGVLSCASKIKENLSFNTYIDDRNIAPSEKKETAQNKRVPLVIYVGPKEYKHQSLIIEFNDQKLELNFNELNNIKDYLNKSLKDKYNQSLKDIYQYDKELVNINDKKLIKVNICENCQIDKYHNFLIPFNRISKTHKCIKCNKEVNNIVYLKK